MLDNVSGLRKGLWCPFDLVIPFISLQNELEGQESDDQDTTENHLRMLWSHITEGKVSISDNKECFT